MNKFFGIVLCLCLGLSAFSSCAYADWESMWEDQIAIAEQAYYTCYEDLILWADTYNNVNGMFPTCPYSLDGCLNDLTKKMQALNPQHPDYNYLLSVYNSAFEWHNIAVYGKNDALDPYNEANIYDMYWAYHDILWQSRYYHAVNATSNYIESDGLWDASINDLSFAWAMVVNFYEWYP